jgi:putative oxidoreductase
MNKFFSATPVYQQEAIALLRIVVGFFIAYHGFEVFDPAKMKGYTEWDAFKGATFMPFLGKGAEFVAGVLLVFGLFTRLAAIITIGTFAYIVFFIGKGKFWMEDQHPFLFVLLGLFFLFTGSGAFSLDSAFFKNRRSGY